MREVASIYLSSNGKEFLIYDRNEQLVSVKAISDLADLGETVVNTVSEAIEE